MKLRLDEMRVDSFSTTPARADEHGTVYANEVTVHFSCPPRYTCPECAPPAHPERDDHD